MKFGGTSVCDANAMKNVACIVKQLQSQKPFVVISAIAQGTNLLEKMGNTASQGEIEVSKETIRDFIARHESIVRYGISNEENKNFLQNILENVAQELADLCQGIYLLQELSPKSLDKLYGFGEFLSSHCVAKILDEAGINAHWIDARTFMITDENFNAANPQMNIVAKKLSNLLAGKNDDTVFVTQGFIGATLQGFPTTMGRESSDFSAAILGAVLKAEEVQIWTDVDGIFTADPNIVTRAKKISTLSYQEALILSERGAKVLHPKTIIPVMENDIPLIVRNSKRVDDVGTKIFSNTMPSSDATAISWMNSLSIISLAPIRGMNYFLIAEILAGIFAKNKITPILQISSQNLLQFVFNEKNSLNSFIQDCVSIGYVEVLEKKALLSLVGKNTFAVNSVLNRIGKILDIVPTYLFFSDVQSKCISIIVDEENIASFAQKIHEEFFE